MVTPEDIRAAAAVVRQALGPHAGEDWEVPAGDLEWTVRKTVSHMTDAVAWYAAQLALPSPVPLRVDIVPHATATNEEVLAAMEASAAVLAAVGRSAPPGVRAYHAAGRADASGFLAMGCDEILIHGWDCARGLGVALDVPGDLARRVLMRLFPWAPADAEPWPALLWANGRADLPGHERPGADWEWHCAPLEEWDGTIPRWPEDPEDPEEPEE